MDRSLVRFLCVLALATSVLTLVSACGSTSPATPTAAPAVSQPAAPTAAPAAKAAEPTKSAAAPAAQSASFPKMNLKLGHAQNPDTPWNRATQKFADLVKERTGGAVNIQIYPASQLGSEKDTDEQVKTGVIDMTVSSSGMVAAFDGWGPIGALAMPYILKGNSEDEEAQSLVKLARSPLIKDAAEKAAKASGMRSLDMAWWYGDRHTTTKSKQITKVDDIKGLKIRVVDSPMQRLAPAALGANVTPMAFSEVYSALQMGVVDGEENPLNTIYTSKFYEVQKYLALTGHMSQNELLLINEKLYQSMSPELQGIMEKAAMEAGDYMTQEQTKANNQNLQDLKDKGMIVTPINKVEFAEKTKDAWKDFESQIGKDFYEKVKAAAN